MMKEITIRNATVSDAPAILDIYGYYVANTAISMEYEVPSLAEFEKRIENTLGNYPYLVAEQDGKIIGAITHVFVRDSTKGYGIFIENMLEAEK